MLSCDLIALPDELLLSCVDMSLRTCVMLGDKTVENEDPPNESIEWL